MVGQGKKEVKEACKVWGEMQFSLSVRLFILWTNSQVPDNDEG